MTKAQKTSKPSAKDLRQLIRANEISEPWERATIEREPWIVTLPTGRTVQLLVPLGAAVEIEAEGINIRAGWLER